LKKGAELMNIEILKPELERRVREGIQSGRFQNVDELLTKALDALSESSGSRLGALDWSKCPTVESVPGRLGGAWVFRDTRLPVSTIFENLEDGATVDEITEWFRISKDQVIAVLEFAARSVAAPASARDAHPV
jgi:uncharacterized protein (DUF433 family)